jgi:uncharacterized protein YndB with AHSA1/START domain
VSQTKPFTPDPRLDLVLKRVVDVPPQLVWQAWTQPKHLMKWFTPAPWTTTECEIDLRPGGIFRTVMRGPEGQVHDNVGCYIEVVPERKLVFTDAMSAGFRPSSSPFFTCILTLEPSGSGTEYVAVAMHKDENDAQKHEQMGFHAGWGKALDQLVAVVKNL